MEGGGQAGGGGLSPGGGPSTFRDRKHTTATTTTTSPAPFNSLLGLLFEPSDVRRPAGSSSDSPQRLRLLTALTNPRVCRSNNVEPRFITRPPASADNPPARPQPPFPARISVSPPSSAAMKRQLFAARLDEGAACFINFKSARGSRRDQIPAN